MLTETIVTQLVLFHYAYSLGRAAILRTFCGFVFLVTEWTRKCLFLHIQGFVLVEFSPLSVVRPCVE